MFDTTPLYPIQIYCTEWEAIMTSTFDWSVVAAAWDEKRDSVTRGTNPVVDELLARLAARPGDRLLELGAGTGDVARRLGELVLPGGTVLATDAAQGMVDLVRATVADQPHVTAEVVDAAEIPLSDGSVDGVLFQMGLMFVPEPQRAASEIRRVLVPGGRAVVATWAAPEHNPWLTCVGMAAMSEGVVAGGPPTGPGGLFSLGTPDALSSALAAGGFEDVEVVEVPVEMRFLDPADYADHVSRLAGPLAAAIAASDKADAVLATAATLVSKWVTDEGVVVPGLALVATATA
jgi:SAM-dependent methyltransferase